ncbi:V-set and immunoglobulin domain-containing protein 4-like isoform X2 [Phalacrocorax aristotelis]|uniref:V-set and immunoglobulin domain-containing protein 4-like isoform X2 n=1 Tax=Phalacrocorax aristotelis TaxID=126867 RepID=UPI003F4C144C
MGMLVRAAVLLSPLLFCNAFLNLTGPSELEGVWKGSTILPCAYVPVKDLVQQTLTWTVVHDQSSGTIFRRDDSGDHVLLSEYRGRVTWKASNNTLIAKEITTKVDVVKVAATKPVIRASEPGLTFAPGARTSLTCVASGSPPISYRWFRSGPGGEALLLSSQAKLAWDSLQPSDTGTYFCEAENRVGARAVQQSDAVELTVRESPVTRQPSPEAGRPQPTPRGDVPQRVPTGTQGTRLSLPLVILIAVVCSAVVFLLVFIIICIRKPKEVQVYEVKDHNLRAAASSRCESAGHYEEPICSTENNYVMEHMVNKRSQEISTEKNEYDCVGNTQESVYEVGDTA